MKNRNSLVRNLVGVSLFILSNQIYGMDIEEVMNYRNTTKSASHDIRNLSEQEYIDIAQGLKKKHDDNEVERIFRNLTADTLDKDGCFAIGEAYEFQNRELDYENYLDKAFKYYDKSRIQGKIQGYDAMINIFDRVSNSVRNKYKKIDLYILAAKQYENWKKPGNAYNKAKKWKKAGDMYKMGGKHGKAEAMYTNARHKQ